MDTQISFSSSNLLCTEVIGWSFYQSGGKLLLSINAMRPFQDHGHQFSGSCFRIMTSYCARILTSGVKLVFSICPSAAGATAHLSHPSQISRLNLLKGKIQRQISVGLLKDSIKSAESSRDLSSSLTNVTAPQ